MHKRETTWVDDILLITLFVVPCTAIMWACVARIVCWIVHPIF